MDFNTQAVQRLGFDSYCSNLVVNLLENGQLTDGFRFENEIYSVAVTKLKSNYSVCIRAYVAGIGWQTTDITI